MTIFYYFFKHVDPFHSACSSFPFTWKFFLLYIWAYFFLFHALLSSLENSVTICWLFIVFCMVTHLIITFKSVSSSIISYPPLLSPSLYFCFFQMLRQHRTYFPLKVYQIVWRNSSDVYSAFIFSCYNPFLNYKNYFCMDHIQLFFLSSNWGNSM